MKKLFTLLLCCLILSGCTGTPTEVSKPTQPTEVSTTPATEQIIQDETLPAESNTPANNDQAPEATTENTPENTIQYIVYSPNENADGFYVNVIEGNIVEGSEYQLTILEAMIEMGVLTEDVQINSIVRVENNLTIDFNQAFRELVCTMGTSGERMIVGSVVNTLIANYEVETVSITVDGEIWESGHVIYDFPMGFFE